MGDTGTHRVRVRTGLDRLLDDSARVRELRGSRVGLLVNPTSVTATYNHAVDALLSAGVEPVRLFGPEHGVRGEAQDMIAVAEDVDPISGIPVVSLYGSTFESLTPTPEQLQGLDVMVIDLQDVGSRYYTYVYSAMLVARACLEVGVDVVVLDRPNPIGPRVEGPDVSSGFESFVGMLPLPNRHGLTLAEVIRFAQLPMASARLEIVPVDGWRRTLWFDEHDAPWVLPSPNMPTLDTATVYPGMCLLEGTDVSEGRGTTRPFEIFGAPWVDPRVLQSALEPLDLPGVIFRPLSFMPTFQKWAGRRCGGLQMHVVDREAFDAFTTGAAVVWALATSFEDEFAFRKDAYEFVDTIPAIDLLFGSARPRELIASGCSFDALRSVLATPARTLAAIDAARLPEYG